MSLESSAFLPVICSSTVALLPLRPCCAESPAPRVVCLLSSSRRCATGILAKFKVVMGARVFPVIRAEQRLAVFDLTFPVTSRPSFSGSQV